MHENAVRLQAAREAVGNWARHLTSEVTDELRASDIISLEDAIVYLLYEQHERVVGTAEKDFTKESNDPG